MRFLFYQKFSGTRNKQIVDKYFELRASTDMNVTCLFKNCFDYLELTIASSYFTSFLLFLIFQWGAFNFVGGLFTSFLIISPQHPSLTLLKSDLTTGLTLLAFCPDFYFIFYPFSPSSLPAVCT